MMVSDRAKELLRNLPSGSRTEEAEQIGLFELIEMQRGRWPELGLAYHPANGGKRGKAEAGRFKAMGVRPGVPDIVLPVGRRGYFGLYVELKREDGVPSDVSKEQSHYILKLSEEGYYASVAYGAVAAWEVLRWYLMGARTITIGVDVTDKMP